MNLGTRTQWALTLLRIYVGTVFIAHGSQKVLGLFGGPGLDGFASWAASFGIPAYLAYLAAAVELVGGVLLLLGIYAELGACMLMPVMVGAFYFVHRTHGFFIQHNGFEYVGCLLVILVTIALSGPGYGALIRSKR
jgi:putative oxidoreductase